MLNSRATAAQADPEALHQAVAVIDMVLADLDAGRISADTAAKTIGLKVLTAREVVMEALRAPQNDGSAAGEWLSIESAPKDGTEVLCLAPEYDGPIMLKFYKYNGLEAWRDWDQDINGPTHWLPVPDHLPLAQPDPSQEPGTGGER